MDSYKFKTTPYQHQLACWEGSKKQKNYGLLMDMGTGKTKVALDTAAYMYDNGWINAVMVFGNNGSYTNWKQAIEEHLPDHIKRTVGVWSSKNKVHEGKEMNEAITSREMCLKFFLMNIEAIAFPKGFEAAFNFTKSHNTLAIVDESTTIANPKAARTKAAWKIGSVAKARRILTGSCLDNRPTDSWAQFQFLSNGILGFTSYYAFRAQYANLEELKIQRGGVLRSFKVVNGYRNLDSLKQAISQVAFIVKKEDCLDLPKKTYMEYNVDLTPEQERMYKELSKRLMTEVENESGSNPIVSVKIALTKMLRLHQLVCGHITDDDKVFHKLPANRLKALSDLLDEAQGRVVIWTSFRPDVDAIAEFLKDKYGAQSFLTYHGGTSNEDREKAKTVFKRGGEVSGLNYLVANDKTGGYGNNFTAITTAIYFSYDFDNNIHHQTQDRIHRIGQTEPVTYVYLKAPGTIDDKIISVLRDKTKLADLCTPSNWRTCFN